MTRHWLLVGLDEKVTWDDGRLRFLAPGRDRLCVLDVGADPGMPRLAATLPLPNSVFGPPTNLAVTPDQSLGLVADSMAWVESADGWTPAPGDGLHVVDLSAEPPVVRERLSVGAQPSGLAINARGTLALVACRAGRGVSVLSIDGARVRHEAQVDLGEEVTAVSFAADGRRAFAVKPRSHRVAVLHVDGTRVRHDPSDDIPTGPVPYNLAVTPDGRLALTVDMGSPTASDGHVDSVSVIDLLASPPRVIDRLMVEDGPEGLAVAPDGRHAAVAVVQGSNHPADCWFHHPAGQVVLLRIDGARVRRVGSAPVGALPEGIAFGPDGRHLYVGNFLDAEIAVLEVGDDALIDTGRRLALPGHPASMRAQSS